MIKLKYHLLFILVALFLSTRLSAQNLFPQKTEACNTSQFCLDCGDPKATYDSTAFATIAEKINKTYNLRGAKGGIMFQVLVDSAGNGCVISHTDIHNFPLSKDIIKYLNACTWISAKEKNKPVSSSINLQFIVKNDKIEGSIERVNIKLMNEDMKNPGTPTIYNKNYQYNNPSLDGYEITVWQKENSALPQDMSQHSVIDKSDQVWYATLNGFVKFDGEKFHYFDEKNSPFTGTTDVGAIAVDKDNNKWVDSGKAIYKFDNKTWTRFDSTKIVVSGAYHIIPNNDEVLFCGNKGLAILKNNQWSFIDNKVIKQLPSNRVYYAFRDQKKRLWIGTFSGSIMIDEDKKVTNFNETDTPLKDICISGAAMDENGNIYFKSYAFKNRSRDSEDEGLIILSKDGQWTHYTDKNSGLPVNQINSLMYDKFEKLLWIGTNSAGIVRFDLKSSWENYHNQNSKVPSTYIYDMSQNSKGEIYVSTYYGMMRIKRK